MPSRLETYDCDCVVVGAGAVGLACAAELARTGREVLVLEKNKVIGAETSSRNSEVIHAGIYYPPQSLKAQTCVAGRQMLIEYLNERHIGNQLCGKLIVAADDNDINEIEKLETNARASCVDSLRWLEADELQKLEPALNAKAALLSPGTGIFDSHQFMTSLRGDLEDHGGVIAFETSVYGGSLDRDKLILFAMGAENAILRCNTAVNATGPCAPMVARGFEGVNADSIPRQYLAKGSYFSSPVRTPFSHLIYPAPADGGLGVHLTLDLAGRMRFGPDIEWLDGDDPSTANCIVNPERAEAYYAVIRKYWPGLPDGALTPDYAGIRPKLSPKGAPAADFRIDGESKHGIRGLINLFGIESPGLTASLALAKIVLKESRAGL